MLTQLPAAVDDFLAAAFHFRVFALHRGEIQVSRAGAGGHRRGRTAAQTDQHGRAAEHDQLGADGDFTFLHVLGANVTHTAGQHDRLVVAAHFLTVRASGSPARRYGSNRSAPDGRIRC